MTQYGNIAATYICNCTLETKYSMLQNINKSKYM